MSETQNSAHKNKVDYTTAYDQSCHMLHLFFFLFFFKPLFVTRDPLRGNPHFQWGPVHSAYTTQAEQYTIN